MNKFLMTAAVAALGATTATAEVTYGTAFARFHDLDAGGGADADVQTFGGTIEFVTGGFTFSGLAARVDLDGGDLDVIDLGAGYRFTPLIEGGLEYTNIDVTGLADTDIVSVYGIYHVGDAAVGLAISDYDDLDDTGVSLFASLDVGDAGRVGIDIIQIDGEELYSVFADYDTQSYELRADFLSTDGLDALALRGAYDITDRFAVTGAVSTFDLAGLDGNAISIGVEYEVLDGFDVDLALGRIDADNAPTIDQVTFGLRFETGDRTSKRRSLARVITDATSNVIGLTDF